jgi:hypothetical protein
MSPLSASARKKVSNALVAREFLDDDRFGKGRVPWFGEIINLWIIRLAPLLYSQYRSAPNGVLTKPGTEETHGGLDQYIL